MFKRALVFAMLAMIVAALALPALLLDFAQAQGSVTVTPNRDYINVRLWPAIGATVIGSMEPGDVMTANGRSVDGDWVRIDFNGDEAWVALLVVDATGDVNSLPLADPRSMPYNNTAGGGSASGPLYGRLEESGLRMRSGPSLAYPVMQNLPRYAEFEVTGRVAANDWLQISWQGLIGWIHIEAVTLYSDSGVTINDVPVIPPAADTGVRLTDRSARDRFLVIDEMRRTMDQAGSTADLMIGLWSTLPLGNWPATCSAPPLVEPYFLNSVSRNLFPDLIEAVRRMNQGVSDVNFAVQTYLDACLNGPAADPGPASEMGLAAVARSREAFADTLYRITSSKAVEVLALHGHVNYAQDQFERIEAIWLDVRFGVTGAPPCVGQPQQPADYGLTDWERANYPELIPAVERLNEGLAILRQSIGLWKDQCDLFQSVPGHVMPPEIGAQGYNLMLEARVILNEVRGTYLIDLYSDPNFIIPAPTSTPDPTIAAILHAPYTPTPVPTATPSFGFSATGSITRSTVHPGCTWFGIAGQVLNADGGPRPATLVHIYGPGLDMRVLSGSDTRYGAAGFEVPVRVDAAQLNTWRARIEDGYGNPLSPEVPIVFADGCEMNVAMLTFTAYR
ncbi:MAG: SH3 domain-containing protein [Anaerolineae bacterium]|nr:SH3 domain-containing protein [Anaerolineae bacterium]